MYIESRRARTIAVLSSRVTCLPRVAMANLRKIKERERERERERARERYDNGFNMITSM